MKTHVTYVGPSASSGKYFRQFGYGMTLQLPRREDSVSKQEMWTFAAACETFCTKQMSYCTQWWVSSILGRGFMPTRSVDTSVGISSLAIAEGTL